MWSWKRRVALGVEALESRNLLSADPLPVLMVIADQRDFYYQEYSDTRLAIEAAGLDVDVAATTTNPSTAHANTGQAPGDPGTVVPDLALADVDADDYSAIVFVGGWGASMYQYAFSRTGGNYYFDSHYNGDVATKQVVNNLINDFAAADKHLAGICHGVTALAWARVDGQSPLDGRQVSIPWVGTPAMMYEGTYYPWFYAAGQYDQVVANGATPNLVSGQYGDPTTAADDVVVDGRVITAENYDSALLFGETIAQEVLAADAEPPPPPPPPPPPAVRMVGNDLVVQGTDGADTVYAWSGSANNQVFVCLNGQPFGPFVLPANGRVKVHGGDGNDKVYATDLRVGAVLLGEGGHDQMTGGHFTDLLDGGDGGDKAWGGPGNDLLRGGAGDDCLGGWDGNDILVGGDGHDWMDGGAGRDILIGGLGHDGLQGGVGDDLLIGGRTAFDDDKESLLAIWSVWMSAADLSGRVAVLSDPASEVRLVWGETVFDDGTADCLCGGDGADWLLATAGEPMCYDPNDVLTMP